MTFQMSRYTKVLVGTLVLTSSILLVGSFVSDARAQSAAPFAADDPRQQLDRTVLRPTFVETFQQFEASALGVVDGQPVWRSTYIGGDRYLPGNKEAQWYTDHGPDGPFRIVDGALEITALPHPGLPHGLTHRSGLITSQYLLSQRYGYFEMRARLPQGKGLWPAFWLLPADGRWPPEIDVMEMLGHAPTAYYVALHAGTKGKPHDEVTVVNTPDLSADYHVFGVSWGPQRIRYYLDDIMVHETATPKDLHEPMYMLVNLAVGGLGSWPGVASPTLSGVYSIAWIKAWQFIALD